MKILKAVFSRTTFLILMAIVEAMIIWGQFVWLRGAAGWIEGVLHVIGALIVLFIVKDSRHLSSDMLWILLIMVLPVIGTAIYMMLGADLITSRTFRNLQKGTAEAKKYYHQDKKILEDLRNVDPERRGQFSYIAENAGFPFYENTGFDYYPLGEDGWPVMLEEMSKAEKFIFLEYFIIEEGKMWDAMLKILEEKAAKGVDVRVMYDDLGSLMTLSGHYASKLEEKGIKCIAFNRLNPIIGSIMNHRDHRKIMVIDGKTAFSGGVNLADEYINVKVIHGHWKDNIIRVKGEAVWSYTVMFLTHWNALRNEDEDFEKFHVISIGGKKDGWIAPYGETPLDTEITSQNIYMGILNHASDYCWIMTPYLIIDTELINALILAAKSGVDVRIMTPGIPDKKFVFSVTQSYYHTLIEGGVRIFEYTPGFVHAKVFVSDDEVAAVGTINLDYRSLYLHFENGTFLYGGEGVKAVRDDFIKTCEQCHEVTLEESRRGPLTAFLLAVMRIAAPMM